MIIALMLSNFGTEKRRRVYEKRKGKEKIGFRVEND